MSATSNDKMLIKAIQDALGTAEEGMALVDVARNAHKAEQREAHFLRLVHDGDMSVETAYESIYGEI